MSAEQLYARPLTRPFDQTARRRIEELIEEHRHSAPIPVRYHWRNESAVLEVKSSLASGQADFSTGRLVVTLRLSLAGRLLFTTANRRRTIEVLDDIAKRIEL